MAAIIFILLLFVIFVGGGWFIGRSIGGILFKNDSENNYNAPITNPIKTKENPNKNKITPSPIKISKPNYKIPLEDIIKKIEIVKFQSKNNETSIYFNNVTMSQYRFLPMYYDSVNNDFLGINFKILGNTIFIEIAISDKKINIFKGTELFFYFENNESIKYTFTNSCVKTQDYNINLIIPKLNELELFAFQNLEYWSLKNLKKGIDIESDNTFFDLKNRMNSKKDFQEILKFLTNKIVQELINLNKGKLK